MSVHVSETLYLAYYCVPECPLMVLGLYRTEREAWDRAGDYEQTLPDYPRWIPNVVAIDVNCAMEERLPFGKWATHDR